MTSRLSSLPFIQHQRLSNMVLETVEWFSSKWVDEDSNRVAFIWNAVCGTPLHMACRSIEHRSGKGQFTHPKDLLSCRGHDLPAV